MRYARLLQDFLDFFQKSASDAILRGVTKCTFFERFGRFGLFSPLLGLGFPPHFPRFPSDAFGVLSCIIWGTRPRAIWERISTDNRAGRCYCRLFVVTLHPLTTTGTPQRGTPNREHPKPRPWIFRPWIFRREFLISPHVNFHPWIFRTHGWIFILFLLRGFLEVFFSQPTVNF